MRVVFVHQAFPAQFRGYAAGLIERGHEVHAILADSAVEMATQCPSLAACELHPYPSPSPDALPQGLCDPGFEAALVRAERVAAVARRLGDGGWAADVVVMHSGWGEGLHLREVWPQALLVAYPELYGVPGLLHLPDPDAPPPTALRLQRLRCQNLLALAALADADASLTPTLFQRDSFPGPWRGRIQVIHEGIDTEQLCADPQRRVQLTPTLELCHGDPLLTFVSRSLEPLRGFCRFLRALPPLLAAHPDLQVAVVGGDSPSYSPPSPHPGGYRGALLAELGPLIDPARVHFLGHLQRQQLTALLQVSAVHAYLSHPYVLSWSLLEAMACAVPVLASDTAPVREVIRDGHNGCLVPLHDTGLIAARLAELLGDPATRARLGTAGRHTVLRRFSRERCVEAFCNWLLSLRLLHSAA